MRYRVHKHCRRPECTDWCVSTPRHTVIYTNQLWSAALDWTLARVTREALTSSPRIAEPVDGIGWVDVQATWNRAVIPPAITWDQITETNAYKERMARWRTAVEHGDLFINCAGRTMQVVPFEPTKLDTEDNPLIGVETRDDSGTEVDYFDSIVNATGMKVPEGFAGLLARAQTTWVRAGYRFAHSDPEADARFAGQGEFATPGVGFSANSAILASSEPNLAGFVGDFDCNDVAENPKIVDTQQISDSGA